MKNIIVICLFISFELVAYNQENPCDPAVLQQAKDLLIENANFLKDFNVYLEKATKKESPPAAKYSMVLSDSTYYQFTIASSSEYPGKAIFQLYAEEKLIGSTYNPTTGKSDPSFQFRCMKTAVYHMLISFIDGEEGCAVGVLAYTGKF